MLGSDPALWPAGERREGELVAYDKGYYHSYKKGEWGIHLTQVATRCCGRAKASTKKRIPRLLLWRGVGLRSASDSRSCRPKAATAMNSRVGRLGGHSHDSRNLTFLFRSREATTHRVYLNEVDTPHSLKTKEKSPEEGS